MSTLAAFCRYGPGTAYLEAADLYEGDHGFLWNRDYTASWLWVRFDKLEYACWVHSSVVMLEEGRDPMTETIAYFPPLPCCSALYGPPQNVRATRDGENVYVTWDVVWMTLDDDRGYLLEVRVCQNGFLIDIAVRTTGTSYWFDDTQDCNSASYGQIYTVEKHGYVAPVPIPWP